MRFEKGFYPSEQIMLQSYKKLKDFYLNENSFRLKIAQIYDQLQNAKKE